MANKGLVTGHGSSRWTRRAFLASSTLAVVALASCGDESSTRQFAGGPQTPGNDGSPGATGVVGSTGSPTALPTQMPVSELLAPRGAALSIPIVQQHRISMVNISSGAVSEIWADPDRAIWAAAADPTGERIAVLSSPKGEVAGWAVDFVASDGTVLGHVELGNRKGTPNPKPDAVAAGLGGVAWIADTTSAAVSLPTGGLQQVYADGSHVRLLSASSAKRPAAVAVTPDAGTIAYVNQPSGSEGSGIYAGSMKAKPIDPVVVLQPDRSGNRSAHDLAWIPAGRRVATVIEREELGMPQGDLFYIDTATGRPTLAWTSPAGSETWSVVAFAVSPDGKVVTFITNPTNPGSHKPSSMWVMQVDGAALERFELPIELHQGRLSFSPDGIAVAGSVRAESSDDELGATYLISPTGQVSAIYEESLPASPVSSPVASPIASPIASPVASPVASPIASPVASQVGSPSPKAATAEA